MNELNYVEQELTELRNHLDKSFGVIDSLTQIQKQFEALAQTHQQLREYLEQAKTTPEIVSEVEEKLKARLLKLETLIESSWNEVRDELMNAQNQIDSANRNLNVQVNQQVSNLKHEFESKIAAIVQQSAVQREYLEQLEARLKHDWLAAFNQLTDAGCNPETFKKFDNRIQGTKSSLRNLEKQINTLQIWLFIAISTAILSVPASLLLLNFSVNQETPGDSFNQETPADSLNQETPADNSLLQLVRPPLFSGSSKIIDPTPSNRFQGSFGELKRVFFGFRP
jgi:prophage DNA circulation protein